MSCRRHLPVGNEAEARALEETAAIERVLHGDKESYTLLVERYSASLYRYLLGLMGRADEAEDLVQEAFLRAYLSLASYNAHYRFSTWLFRIATNMARNRIKVRQREVSLDALQGTPAVPAVILADLASCPERQVERKELSHSIHECISQLPPAYQIVHTLRYIAELSYAEIALCADLPVNTVRSRLHRGRERLGKCLQERLFHEE